MAGLRVLRGPDWIHGNEDGGEGHLGTVVNIEYKMVEVIWDNGSRTSCRIGKDDKHDVLVFDNATIGVRHTGVTCCACDEEGIRGMRWKCALCKKCDLCPVCYVKDKHDLSHEFFRYTTPNSDGVKVKKRLNCQRIQSTGIFPGATVERGPDWKWDDQDGGQGKHGTVISIKNSSDGFTARNMVGVDWDHGESGTYRVGANGKVDLKFVEECPGTYYYKDHLPYVDGSTNVQSVPEPQTDSETLQEGDTVCIKLSAEVLKAKQNQSSSWAVGMADCIGKLGIIKNFRPNGEVIVEFDGLRYRFLRGALQKVPQMSVGNIVRINSDEEKVKVMQKSNGGWETNMRQALGKCGKVVKVDPERGVVVAFGQKTWLFNPACCTLAPGKCVDSIDRSSSSSSSSSDTSPTSSSGDVQGQPDMQDAVLKMLAKLMVKTDHGSSPTANSDQLYVAIAEGNVDRVRTIVRSRPNLVNERHKGVTPLIIASREGQMEIVKVLLENNAEKEPTDDKGNTALCYALNGKNENVAKLLLEKGAKANMSNKNGRTPLHFAAYANLSEACKLLIQHGSQVNTKDTDGDTALHDAIQKGHQEVVDVICRASKLDLTVHNQKGFTPLQFASLRNHAYAVGRIIQRDASTVNTKMPKMLFTALHIAANNNHIKCARLLIVEGKASLDATDENGVTPLHLACHEAYYDTVELLLEKGASFGLKDVNGNTPLHLAMAVSKATNSNDLLASLLGMGHGDDDSVRVRISCLLIQKGASYTVNNNQRDTPLEAAKNERIRRGVVQYIKSRGGRCTSARPSSPVSAHDLFNLQLPCAKCMEKMSVITTQPCGHKVLCRECCLKVQQCPICERFIERRIAKRSAAKEEVMEVPCKVQ